MEGTNVKKTTNDRRKQQDSTNSKSPAVTEITELLDCLSTEINTSSQIHSPITFQGKSVTPKLTQDTLRNCFICFTILGKTELVDCPICLIKGNNNCYR